MNTSRNRNLLTIVAVGLMAALVLVSSYISIPIPTAIGNTRIHFGNIFCLLAGLLLGWRRGGLAAGLGSMIFDLLNPLYIASAPFTLVFKGIMAAVCGGIAYSGHTNAEKPLRNTIGAAAGAIIYVVLYLSKSFFEATFVLHHPAAAAWIDVAQKGVVSLTNGLIAVVISVPLFFALRKGLERAKLSYLFEQPTKKANKQ